MSETDRQVIERRLPFLSGKISLLSLQAFDTEQQFSCQIRFILYFFIPSNFEFILAGDFKRLLIIVHLHWPSMTPYFLRIFIVIIAP